MRREENQQWEALLYVLAAGGVALLFVGLGWWAATRKREGGSAAAAPALGGIDEAINRWVNAGAPGAMPESVAPAPSRRQLTAVVKAPLDDNPETQRFVLTSTPIELIGYAGGTRARKVLITTDQPIRVDYYKSVLSAANGLYVAAGQPMEMVVGPNQTLYGVRATGTNSNVGLHIWRL